MKKTMIAGILAATLTGAVHAQTLSDAQIYGVMDVGVLSVDGVGANNERATQFHNGGVATSRLGFRGTENLGGGLKAGFQLESQIMPNNGSNGTSSASGSANAMFSRQANMWIEGSFGKLTMGRSGNASKQAFDTGDSRGGLNMGSSANLYSDFASFGGTATAKTGLGTLTGGTFLSNQFRYDTPKFGGFSASFTYAPGGQPGDDSKGTLQSHALRWSGHGANIAVGYYATESTAGVKGGEVHNIGANYGLTKDLRIYAAQANIKNRALVGQSNSDFQLNSYGAKYDVSPKVVLTAGYYTLKDKFDSANGNKTTAVGVDYALSKRTALYTVWARSANQGASGFATYGAGNANLNSLVGTSNYPSIMQNAGITQTALAMGIRHSF
jgi:predicted porin